MAGKLVRHFAVLIITFALFGCKPSVQNGSVTMAGSSSSSHLSPAAQKLWETYSRSTIPQGHSAQPGCRAHHFTLPQGVAFRGVAILIHGFTACPQQFFEWAAMLTASGYEVLAPIMPGFGLNPSPANDPAWPEPVKDVVDFLPKAEDLISDPLDPGKSKYALLAEQMNAIAAATQGERVIAGISVGAAVAAHAINLQPKLYRRGLLLAPFFAVDTYITRQLVDAVNLSQWSRSLDSQYNTLEKLYALADHNLFAKAYLALREAGLADKILNIRHTWGPGCYQERSRGRAGICDFLFSNLAAAESFGLKVIDETRPTETFIQVVGVEDDKVASTGHMVKALKALSGNSQGSGRTSSGGQVAACFFRSGANHSLLSRYDNPDQEKFWLNDLLKDATAFVANSDSMPYPESNSVSLLAPYRQCRLSQ